MARMKVRARIKRWLLRKLLRNCVWNVHVNQQDDLALIYIDKDILIDLHGVPITINVDGRWVDKQAPAQAEKDGEVK